jgi:hypothetical protein
LNIIDENIVEEQRKYLQEHRIRFRQIGDQVGRSGMKDPEIIPLLRSLTMPTFFTHDKGFFNRRLCAQAYCIVQLDVGSNQTGQFMRDLLRHKQFDTSRKRMGTVLRVSQEGILVYRQHMTEPELIAW